ncbi:MAG: IPT/TIG domain-containing protein, partial [Cyanobacteria bacterium REEB65]|nr:IPT/TIG domain-containing protein [Cyanobacteria bacterium REEB65]
MRQKGSGCDIRRATVSLQLQKGSGCDIRRATVSLQLQRGSGRETWRRLCALATAAMLCLATGCSFGHAVSSTSNYPGGGSAISRGEAALASSGQFVLRGTVDWGLPVLPPGLTTQAVSVTTNATLALIDTASGVTVGTGVTDNNGNFNLSTGNYPPITGEFYILEAVKGANAQLPGYQAPRLRTIVQWSGQGWLSITNATIGGWITVNQLTTALALEVNLGNVPASQVLGTVNTQVSPPVLTGSAVPNGLNGHSDAEFNTLATDIKNYINNTTNGVANPLDPIQQINAIKPTMSTISPTSANSGTVLVINGVGFDTNTGATTVNFAKAAGGTLPGTILLVTPAQIYAQIPNGASTGNVTVTTPQGTSNGIPFVIPNGNLVAISNVTPNPVSLGGTITILGANFTSPANTNTVVFPVSGGATASGTITNGDIDSLGVTIPQNAVSGTIDVSNATGTSNQYFLNVSNTGIPVINSVFPIEGVANQDVILNGILFGNTPGTVTVTDTSGNAFVATIQYWRDNQVRFKVPWQVVGASGGSQVTITLYNSSQQAVAHAWTALAGLVQFGSWTAYPTQLTKNCNVAGGCTQAVEAIPVWSGTNLYILGGGDSNNIAQLALANT